MGALEKSIGWSLMDSNGELASCLLFKTEKAANKYKTAMNERYPEGKYELIELFVRRAEHGIDGRTAQVGRMGSKGIDREEASPPAADRYRKTELVPGIRQTVLLQGIRAGFCGFRLHESGNAVEERPSGRAGWGNSQVLCGE